MKYRFHFFIVLLFVHGASMADGLPKVVLKEEILQRLNKPANLTRRIAPVAKVQVTTQAILFEFGTAELVGAQSLEQIRQLGEALRDPRMKEAQVIVQGHTDNVGSDEHNQKLSEARASKIVEILTQKYGVPSRSLKAVGKGRSEPVAGTVQSQTEEQRAHNRRVIFERVK